MLNPSGYIILARTPCAVAISMSCTDARRALPCRVWIRNTYRTASTITEHTATYSRDAGMITDPSRNTPSATCGMICESGPNTSSATDCRIMATPMVAIMPFSSSCRNGLSTVHSTSQPSAAVTTKAPRSATRNGASQWLMST
ncbi:hypothetical protein D3C72_1363950 [compost metagenome]